MSIPQWAVEHGRGIGRRTSVFEDVGRALTCAVLNAETDYPALVTMPDGQQYAVVRMQPHVELFVGRRFTGRP